MKRHANAARIALLLASVAASPFALCAPALAQDASATEDETVVVTARRREESLQDVPIAISVQTAEQLDQRGASDITAIGQTTPNSTIQVARGSNSTLIAFIRGVGQQDPLWGFEPGVGLYIDDVYVARPQGAVLDIFDIQRVEVLRGPQGTLYGRNTIGGAIKYVTAPLDPDEAHLTARVNVGTYGQLDTILSGSAPLSDTLTVGGALALYSRDGYGENLTTGAEHYNKDVDAFRLSAEWRPTDDLFFRFSADHVVDDSAPRHGHRETGFAGLPAYDPPADPYDTRAGIGDDNKVETTGYSITGEWTINEYWTAKSITAYREGRTDTLIDFDNTENPTLDVPAFYEDEQFTQEFQLLFTGDRVQGVAGLYYLNAYAEGAFDTVVTTANIATYGKVSTTSLAAFADVSFDITDALHISVGGRYTQDDKEGLVYRATYLGLRSPFFGGPDVAPLLLRTNYQNSDTFDQFTGHLTVSYDFSDDLNVYASYANGFKSGGFDMRGDAYVYPDTVNGYDPETVDSYEIGLKGSLANGRFTFATDVFYADYQDQQITSQFALPTTPPSVISFVDNAGSSEMKGWEFEGTAFFTDNLVANVQVGYLDAQFNEFITYNPGTGLRENLADQRDFQMSPEWTAGGSLTYSFAGLGGTFAMTPSFSYRSEAQLFELANPALDPDSYTLYNAVASWTSDSNRLRLALNGQNLSDELYVVGGYAFPTIGNSNIAFYGPPRTVTASVEVRF